MATGSAASARDVRLPCVQSDVRPGIRGKFVFVGSQKFFIKGVTYGAFRANDAGVAFHDCQKIRRDFAMMASNGINTVRIQHTTPPVHLLDIAAEHDLRVMVGLSAEQHVGYLFDGKRPARAFADIRSKVRSVERHPALLCYALGSEIPAAVARWLGRERIERFLHDLYKAVKDDDPDALVTYVNYPSTEYLQLPFLEFCCFNVYLEKQEQLEAYLARLQNIALDRPLIVSELGLCSRRNGAAVQADVLNWQIRTTFEAGCAGAVVVSWTDEWYSGGADVTDWEFGLTDRHRSPKSALVSVRRAFEECPFPPQTNEPLISVVVCSYNGSRTIGECLDHLSKLNYSNYEVIVVDDGSTDNTAEIAQRNNIRLIRTENRGLSAARNTGREQAHGEIVAYIDDDAYPDPDWLNYYSRAFQRTSHALIGGPNLVPLSDPPVAQCVARSPGGPTHVLLTDTLAEHVPGCNMAFRKSCLEQIGGFDPIFRTAGDDVDICWRIQEKGWTIGFAPAALVWHHRRSSLLNYWKQQRGYGKAEALLHQKWPGRFNISNHLPWAGRIYLAGVGLLRGSRSVIYHGVWGEAPFQGLQCDAAALWEHLLEIPELYLLNAALALLSALGLLWRPMLAFVPLLCIGAGYPLVRAALNARQARFPTLRRFHQLRLRALTTLLHVMQPLARLWGRLQHGLTPWKPRGRTGAVLPYRRQWALWTETWIDPHERLRKLERTIGATGLTVWRGNPYEAWDLEVVGGLLGSTRVLMAVEDNDSGRQYIRLVAWPRYSKLGLMLAFAGITIAGAAALSGQFVVAGALLAGSILLLGRTVIEAGRSLATILIATHQEKEKPSAPKQSNVRIFSPLPAHSIVARLQHASVGTSGSDGLMLLSSDATVLQNSAASVTGPIGVGLTSTAIHCTPNLGFVDVSRGSFTKPRTHISVRGKFLFVGEEKLYIRGVTYGTFRPDEQGTQFPPQDVVEQDFTQMAASGFNALRVYTPPPVWLLDLAWQHGLVVMVGLPWEQHIAFLDQPGLPAAIEQRLRSAIRDSADHPAVLCYVVGNEIPAPIVRWHGPRRIERFIHRLYRAVKAEAPETLVTYVNYPTTEYLDLPFLDFFCFNVYLENSETLGAYLAQLQNLAGDRPLVMAEIGLDSQRNGEIAQSETLEWQIRTIFAAGCAGMFVFAWTDEWYRGGYDIGDWDFGLTTRKRDPKPALASVSAAFVNVPFPSGSQWPKISVVVCTHNGARTLRNCLEGLQQLEYPDYEVIIVDDGSKDESAAIAQEYPFRLICTANRGLGSARNTGMEAACGEIIAYTDDDARPDPHWLHYLAWTFMNTDYAGVGGPNIAPPEDGPIAECVANAPGGPAHVLITHRDAEHIPGCNCSFRKDRLMAVGGFDPRFRTAGDDVDICWRLLEQGWKIGFHPGAMVWHHRRPSVRRYWTQQRGYGSAEALLEAKWPSKYNSFGHVTWTGRLYGRGLTQSFGRWRVYHGFWGSAPFQRLYTAGPGTLAQLPLMPEWYLLNLALAGLLMLSPPLQLMRLEAIALCISMLVPPVYVAKSVAEAPFLHDKLRYRVLTGVLHIIQPVARLWGRFAYGLTPRKRLGLLGWSALRSRVLRVWSEQEKPSEEWLQSLEKLLLSDGAVVRRGGDFDAWDLETRGGLAGTARLKMAIEEHGAGKQMLLFHVRPCMSPSAVAFLILITFVSGAAFFGQNLLLGDAFAAMVLLVLFRMIDDCAVAAAAVHSSVESLSQKVLTKSEAVGSVVYLGPSE